MRKVSILRRKAIRVFNRPRNLEFSEFKGYPSGTYFGFSSLRELLIVTVAEFRKYYGDSLRKWRLD